MHEAKTGQFKKILIGFIILLIGTNLINYLLFGYKPKAVPAAMEPGEEESPGDVALLEELSLLKEVFDKVTENYFEPVDRTELIHGAIRGALEALEDPQTSFLDSSDVENFLVNTTGTFGGIGVKIVNVDDSVVIYEVIPGTPAERGNLLPGDRIRAVDGTDLTGLSVNKAAKLLRGEAGSSVEIAIERPGAAEPFTLSLQRDMIQTVTVTSKMLDDGLGYIKISNFDSRTGSSFSEQLFALEAAGMEAGLILDLRDNPGGLVDEAVKVAKELVPEGEIARLVDQHGQVRDIFYSIAPRKPYPLVVLVNEDTASAAEIVAGALQDRDAALLVGAKTYGKATVQHLVRLSGGNALQLTVFKYLTPSGRDLHEQGLEPDYPVPISPALRKYRQFMPGKLEQGSIGTDIQLLQEILSELGYPVEPSGFFDESTAAALASFQEDSGLAAHGRFDDLTWVQIREALDRLAETGDVQMEKALELIAQPGQWAHLGR
ncbi:MAG: S41 family peptidase [Firmicutes bacterium]|jgi:carboxyl-terminal processing protease|nr:S41 family peptidase [Bacillota bacterium]